MALSTNNPIPSVSPPRDMMFKEIPATNIRKKVETTEIGIANPMIRVVFQLRRKKNSTMMASIPPKRAVRRTSVTD